jgi:uncharacterized phage protein gp47/JayE
MAINLTDLVFIDATGYHFADYPSFLTWRTQQYQAIYGSDVYVAPNSQDGQMLAIQAKADYDTAALGASIYNSFSPATAQGVGLSRNVKINGLKREVPSFSTVTVTIVGTAGTVITNGIAQDSLNQQWLLPNTVTIPGPGTIDVTATAALVGAVFAGANTITTIFTPTRGWQTVNNAAAATPGAPVETDAELRVRQEQSTQIPALTVFDATLGALGNLTGVTKVGGYENDTDTTDGNSVPGHTCAFVVAGGDAQTICNTIRTYKTPGTGTYGNTTHLTVDSKGVPLNISYQTAVVATIGVEVIGSVLPGYSTQSVALIQAAVAAIINAYGIGALIQYTTLFGPAYLTGTPQFGTFNISAIEIKKNGGSFSAANIQLDWDEEAVCNPSTNVTVTIT